MKKVAMIGCGAWGTAVATVLAKNGCTVKLWCHEQKIADTIKQTGCNQTYLPGIQLSESIQPVTGLQEALCGAEWVFETLPVKFMRSVLGKAKPYFSQEKQWVILSKGIEQDTLLLPSQVLDDVFGCTVKKAVVSGPSFALEVVQKQPTGVTVAATDDNLGIELQKLLATDFLRPYLTTDLIGVQLGGALKNVIALGIGLLDGAGYADNTKAFFMTCGLQEMVTCAQALGGRQETIYGLSGVGDLVLTCMGKRSRNLMVGKRLAQGESLEKILETGLISEGISTVKSVYQLAKKYSLQLSLCSGIYEVIFENKKLNDMVTELMGQQLLKIY